MTKSKERRETQLFVVEGLREISIATASGWTPQIVYYLPHIIPDPYPQLHLSGDIPCQPVSPAVYKKIAYREGTEGAVAVMHQKNTTLTHLNLPPNPLIIVMESIEKPGNIGAMLRTADAAQVDAVLICDPHCDLYNPNLIRASIGALFTRQVVVCTSIEALTWLLHHQISIFAATLQHSVPYHTQNYRSPCAIVVGSEAHGLSPLWRDAACARIHIPMSGAVDSLNVSVSAAILLFEAIRQRVSTF